MTTVEDEDLLKAVMQAENEWMNDKLLEATVKAEIEHPNYNWRKALEPVQYNVVERLWDECYPRAVKYLWKESNGIRTMRQYARKYKGFTNDDPRYAGDLHEKKDYKPWFVLMMETAYTHYLMSEGWPDRPLLRDIIRKLSRRMMTSVFDVRHLDYVQRNLSSKYRVYREPLWWRHKWGMRTFTKAERKSTEYRKHLEKRGWARMEASRKAPSAFGPAAIDSARKPKASDVGVNLGIPWGHIRSYLDSRAENRMETEK